ncbi:MAG: adenylosuccinate lyase [Candidatus Micrarchaeota archaeon]
MEQDFSNYLSVFSWRYGSAEMRKLFSEVENRKKWRKVWMALARAQGKAGLIDEKHLKKIEENIGNIDIAAAHKIEREIKHDLMAELKVFAQQSGEAGGKLHLGATSMDIEDNAEALKLHEGIKIIKRGIGACLIAYRKQIKKYKNLQIIAQTHLQTAEPSTLGYRFTIYAQDLLLDLELLETVEKMVKGKGFKGAVGTSAAYEKLLKGKMKPEEMEKLAMQELKLTAFEATTQTYPRKIDFLVVSALASVAASLHKFAFDLRILQSPFIYELAEPFGDKQVGSSAMPFKRNPIKAERVCSLGRFVSALPQVMWGNAANSLLERTLDDSANRRIVIPEAFFGVDESLRICQGLIEGMVVNEVQIRRNLDKYAPFAMTEVLLVELAKKGADRQKMHELIREMSMMAWRVVQEGKENPLKKLAMENKAISKYLSEAEIKDAFNTRSHIGNAIDKCERFDSLIGSSIRHELSVARKGTEF